VIGFQKSGADQNTVVIFIKADDPFSPGLCPVVQLAGKLHGSVIVVKKKAAVSAVTEQ